jgi:DNA-binding response OmpR family regulator
MLLNFQLPVRSALDVVQWVRHHPECNVVPIIFFSDTPTSDEVKRSYELGINTVFKKPKTQAEMMEAIEVLGKYWAEAEVPEPPASHKCE